MLGSFLILYCILTIFGPFLFTDDVRDFGCDPSGAADNVTCDASGSEVFGAMLGVAFAAQGVSQFGNFAEAFTAARVAVYEALLAMDRFPGTEQVILYKDDEDDLGTTQHSKKSATEETMVRAILPAYAIDSTSKEGKKPETILGDIRVEDVHFSYPTRPGDSILKGLSVDIQAGQTVAFVGPSGSGKSTVVGLLERFYDPEKGRVTIDGVDVKDMNVSHLRSMIGYVGQEPTLFDTTIRQNILYGNPSATDEQIEEAARMANAHDFISSFADGYNTKVGDKGSQLSGGQKQRIAIARVLVGKPRILLLDEATSALDAESELVVQEALDNILQTQKITTAVIAHRLSTIRNADTINVIHGGVVVESGSHDELMDRQDYYYRLVQKQDGGDSEQVDSAPSSRVSSAINLAGMDTSDAVDHLRFDNVTFAYPSRPTRTVFTNFNLTIKKGQTVALVGPSGQGKSRTSFFARISYFLLQENPPRLVSLSVSTIQKRVP